MSNLLNKKLAGATLPALQQVFDSGSASDKASFQSSVSGDLTSADVVVWGGTPAGVAAAVAAAKLGKRVILLSESDRIGGCSVGALTIRM
jgi:NADPH-dependent 2,4-dienoyl-CoA reductase/sulfur reductase-like enzyme